MALLRHSVIRGTSQDGNCRHCPRLWAVLAKVETIVTEQAHRNMFSSSNLRHRPPCIAAATVASGRAARRKRAATVSGWAATPCALLSAGAGIGGGDSVIRTEYQIPRSPRRGPCGARRAADARLARRASKRDARAFWGPPAKGKLVAHGRSMRDMGVAH